MTIVDSIISQNRSAVLHCARMAMGTRRNDDGNTPLWVRTSDLPTSPGHPFYTRLNALLDAHDFDRFVERLCRAFYADGHGTTEPGARASTSGCCWSATSRASTRNAASRGARRTRWRSAVFCGWPWTKPPPIIRRFRAPGA